MSVSNMEGVFWAFLLVLDDNVMRRKLFNQSTSQRGTVSKCPGAAAHPAAIALVASFCGFAAAVVIVVEVVVVAAAAVAVAFVVTVTVTDGGGSGGVDVAAAAAVVVVLGGGGGGGGGGVVGFW